MRSTPQQSSSHSLLRKLLTVLGLLVALGVGQGTLANAEESAATPAHAAAGEKAEAAGMSGPQVYNAVCIACHSPPGIGGAPALGDAAAWAPRLERGMDTLINHALNGFSGSAGIMPRKGGRLDLSDDEVIRAVEYMVERAVQ